MLITVFYQLLLFIGRYILLVRFKLVDEVLDMLVLDAELYGYIEDGYFIFDGGH